MTKSNTTSERKPASPPDAEAIHNGLLATASDLLAKDGRLMPCVFVHFESGVAAPFLSLGFNDDEEKDSFCGLIRTMTTAFPTSYVTVMMEVWYLDLSSAAPESRSLMPSQSDHRKEAVVISCEWNSGAAASWLHEIERDATGAFAGLKPCLQAGDVEFSGRFTHLIPPPGMPIVDEIRELAVEALRLQLGNQVDKIAAMIRSGAPTAATGTH